MSSSALELDLSTADGLWLEARSDDDRVARSYSIHVSRDLFGAVVLECRWGRRGRTSRMKIMSFVDHRLAQRAVDRLLARRRSLERRIGVAYRSV